MEKKFDIQSMFSNFSVILEFCKQFQKLALEHERKRAAIDRKKLALSRVGTTLEPAKANFLRIKNDSKGNEARRKSWVVENVISAANDAQDLHTFLTSTMSSDGSNREEELEPRRFRRRVPSNQSVRKVLQRRTVHEIPKGLTVASSGTLTPPKVVEPDFQSQVQTKTEDKIKPVKAVKKLSLFERLSQPKVKQKHENLKTRNTSPVKLTQTGRVEERKKIVKNIEPKIPKETKSKFTTDKNNLPSYMRSTKNTRTKTQLSQSSPRPTTPKITTTPKIVRKIIKKPIATEKENSKDLGYSTVSTSSTHSRPETKTRLRSTDNFMIICQFFKHL